MLVLKSHGRNFESHDHFGRLPTHDNQAFVAAPASLPADVRCVKEALLSRIREGIDVGMSEKEVHLLRWHGAKATMTSYMQHLGLSPRQCASPETGDNARIACQIPTFVRRRH